MTPFIGNSRTNVTNLCSPRRQSLAILGEVGLGDWLTGRTRESFLGVLGMYRVFSWVVNMGTNMGKIFINITPTIDAALITSI